MILVSIFLISLVSVVDPQCQTIIDANSQTLDLIRTIQLAYTLTWIEKSPDQAEEISWSREGRNERITCVVNPNGPAAGEHARTITDLVINGDTCKFLRNWDPKNPPKIAPTRPGNVRADVSPRSHVNPGTLAPSHHLYLEVDGNPRRTLSELAKVSPKVTCRGKVQLDGRDLWLITLESPEETTATTKKKTYDVYLDPLAGYMIRKVIVHANVMRPDGKTFVDSHAHEVTEFKDFGDGIFVPMRVRNGTLDKWYTECVVTSAKVNEPIPAETFEMQWPKFALVRYHPPVNGVLRFDVWGDGKPLRQFQGSDDLRPFEAELRKDPKIAAELGPETGRVPTPPPPSMMAKLAIALAALLVAMVALVVFRRVREQRAA